MLDIDTAEQVLTFHIPQNAEEVFDILGMYPYEYEGGV